VTADTDRDCVPLRKQAPSIISSCERRAEIPRRWHNGPVGTRTPVDGNALATLVQRTAAGTQPRDDRPKKRDGAAPIAAARAHAAWWVFWVCPDFIADSRAVGPGGESVPEESRPSEGQNERSRQTSFSPEMIAHCTGWRRVSRRSRSGQHSWCRPSDGRILMTRPTAGGDGRLDEWRLRRRCRRPVFGCPDQWSVCAHHRRPQVKRAAKSPTARDRIEAAKPKHISPFQTRGGTA